MRPIVIGVVALQGAFAKHIEVLKHLQVKTKEVRSPKDLALCDALIVPGGESTVILKQMLFIEFQEAFREFAAKKPVFGTCAGLILMSKEIIKDKIQPFCFLEISVERNAFGRQIESFQAEIEISFQADQIFSFPAVFIRAPRIRSVSEHVKILAQYKGEPVLVQQGHFLGATFHPELTDDSAIHAYFLKLIHRSKSE